MALSFLHSITSRFSSHPTDLFSPPSPNPSEMEAYYPYDQEEGASKEAARNWNVLFVGGILNQEEHVAANVEELRRKTDPAISAFWNTVYAKEGESRASEPEVVQVLSVSIEDFLRRGRLCIIAHSHGAKVVRLALEDLKVREKIRPYEEKLEVYTYGGVTTVQTMYARRVVNYKNDDDRVMFLGQVAWHKSNQTSWESCGERGGHQFIGGYADHAAGVVNTFIHKTDMQTH